MNKSYCTSPTRCWYSVDGRRDYSVGLVDFDYLIALAINGEAKHTSCLIRSKWWERLWWLKIRRPVQHEIDKWNALTKTERCMVITAIATVLNLFT